MTEDDFNFDKRNVISPSAVYMTHVNPPIHTGAVVGFILAFLIPIVGLIVSWSAKRTIDRQHLSGRGLAIAGVVIGWIGTIIWTIVLVLAVSIYFTAASFINGQV